MKTLKLRRWPGRKKGFTFVEVLLGSALLGMSLLGLAQFLLYGIANNKRAYEVGQGMFLARQQVEYLRMLTAAEIEAFPSTARGESNDEQIDLNQDGTTDFRRLTKITASGVVYTVQVIILPPNILSASANAVWNNPENYQVRAYANTVIGR
jgi:Tfp pilus assembly protein PilV